MEHKLQNSLDWNVIRTRLHNSAQENIPEFRGDIDRLLKSIDSKVTTLSGLEVEVRAHRLKPKHLQEHVDAINKEIKTFQKYYMVALMFKS